MSKKPWDRDFAKERPHHPGALDTDDLTVGRKVRFHFQGGSTEDLLIASEPYIDPAYGSTWIDIVDSSGGAERYALADFGVVPYKDGSWSLTNHVTAIP